MQYQSLKAELQYAWQPFALDGRHLTFNEHVLARLERDRCSSWGPGVYKWEGTIATGPHGGKRGLLIGETADLRQRIKQYVTGTQERGNRLWRETFLKTGDIRLYTLRLESFVVSGREPASASAVLASLNFHGSPLT